MTHDITDDGCSCGWENPIAWGDPDVSVAPCKEGHFDCAKYEDGPCLNAMWAAAYDRHLRGAS